MSEIKLGHRIYYFVDPNNAETVHSTEAYSAAEAAIILGEFLHVTATRLIDVTNYDQQP